MSIRFYDKGEHRSGFVGFRVTREIYGCSTTRQKYFSLNDYSYADAYTLAHDLNSEWDLESEREKAKRRANTCKISSTPLAITVDSLASVTLMAEESGIRSTRQLSVFLKCASQEGNCLYDIFNLPTDTSEYKSLCGTVRQLMRGSASRGHDGADLLTWGELVYGKEREVVLTTRGYMLYSKIKFELDQTG